jgi:hypothetical protein
VVVVEVVAAAAVVVAAAAEVGNAMGTAAVVVVGNAMGTAAGMAVVAAVDIHPHRVGTVAVVHEMDMEVDMRVRAVMEGMVVGTVAAGVTGGGIMEGATNMTVAAIDREAEIVNVEDMTLIMAVVGAVIIATTPVTMIEGETQRGGGMVGAKMAMEVEVATHSMAAAAVAAAAVAAAVPAVSTVSPQQQGTTVPISRKVLAGVGKLHRSNGRTTARTAGLLQVPPEEEAVATTVGGGGVTTVGRGGGTVERVVGKAGKEATTEVAATIQSSRLIQVMWVGHSASAARRSRCLNLLDRVIRSTGRWSSCAKECMRSRSTVR